MASRERRRFSLAYYCSLCVCFFVESLARTLLSPKPD